MKVAIVCGDDADLDQNTADEHSLFCLALARQGVVVTAFQRRREGCAPPADQPFRTVSSRVGPDGPVQPVEVLPYIGEWASELAAQWATDPPEIVHAFGWLGGLAAQLAARGSAFPVVQSFHGLATNEVERARIEPLLVRNATWVTGGSTDEVDALTKLRRRRARLSILSTGVDVEQYAPAGLKTPDGAALRVLQMAPDTLPCSGFDKTIRVLPRLAEVELVIAETGTRSGESETSRAALQRLATDLKVADRVSLLGTVEPDAVPSLLQTADVVVSMPRQAPRATTALQAMASGVVVVGAAVDALTDTVINGVTGLLVSPTEPHELGFALRTLQTQSFRRQSMGSAGRSRAVSRFSWDRIALDAQRIYHQATSALLPTRRSTAARAKLDTTA